MGEPETLRLGRYRVVSVLGRSHFAVVYEAQDGKSGDRVAVKALNLAGTHRNIAEAMFQKEVGALAGIEHPAVVRLIDHFSEPVEDRLGIVLELVPGGRTLEQLIGEVQAAREPRRSLHWRFVQLGRVLDGLETAHRHNVVHRDVKLSNVLLDRDHDALKLADFGIARLLENYGKGTPGLTLREFYTRPFAAPEQVLHGDAGPAADLHAFGLVAASVLAWQVPGPGFKPEELSVLLAPLRDEIRDVALYQELEQMLRRLLLDEPSQRPKAHEVGRVLRNFAERTADKAAVPVRMTTTARDKARESGCRTDAEILADLNEGLRARYEPTTDKKTGKESFSIKCYGRGLWAQLRPDIAFPDQLIVVGIGRNPPNIHASQRESGDVVSVSLTVGVGSAQGLIDPLFAAHLEHLREQDERRKKEGLLEIAQFALSRQRERLARLRVRYRLIEAPGRAPLTTGPAASSSGAPGRHPGGGAAPGAIPGSLLRVAVSQVSTDEDDDEASPELQETWTDGLTNKSQFLIGGLRFATFHGFDRESRTLSLRILEPRKVPPEGVLECKDIAMEASLKRQEIALEHFFRDECINRGLGNLLLRPEENRLGDVVPRALFQDLQPKVFMQSLVERALAAEDFFLIQGPPGTGKTTTIAEVMGQILKHYPDARILLTSQANEAVDNALDALRGVAKSCGGDWRLLRDSPPERARRSPEGTFESGFREWVDRTRDRCKAAESALDPSFTGGKRKAVLDALAHWRSRIDRTEDVRNDFAESVQVFGVTCLRVPTLWKLLREVTFDWVIVDEAAKATPAEVMVSLVVGRRFVLVGDHRQLPPFLDAETEQDLANAKLDPAKAKRSLFEDLFGNIAETTRATLQRQFRMHRSIGTFVGDLYYSDLGGLATGVPDSEREIALAAFDRPHRVFWLDVAGRETPDGTSWWNGQEVDAITRLLRGFNEELRPKGVTYSVGVIAAYAAQVPRLERSLVPTASGWTNLKIRVHTVHAFQGKQDDIIVYSFVRVGERERKFISDRRMLNVAFSRAKRLLVIVGHKRSAEASPEIARAIGLIPSENVLSDGGTP